jgi:hypothetical protein
MLVLPNGMSAKKTESLHARELAWLGLAEDVCRKLNLTICCQRCLAAGLKNGAVLKGANDPSDRTLSVTCGCRRLEFQKSEDA